MGESTSAEQARTTVDDPPTSLPTLERPLGRFPRARAIAAAIGTGLLAGGVLLGLYSWFGATTRAVSSTLAQPAQFAAISSVLGAVVLAIVVAAWFAGRRRTIDLWNNQHTWELRVSGATELAIVFLIGMSWRMHLPSSYSVIRAEQRYFDQLPTAVGATFLVGAGAILTLLLTIHMGLARTLSRRILATAIAAGLAVSAAVGITAVRAGDDSANIDHLTVAPTPIGPVPSRLGTEAFRLQLPPINERQEATGRKVIAAGTGFVVVSIDGLRAFDGATGEPRWHYLRRSQSGHRALSPERESPFTTADGSVLISRWYGGGETIVFAFDAVTGRILWNSNEDNDFAADHRHRASSLIESATSKEVLLVSRTAVTGYDARTAERRWSVPVQSDCTPREGDTLVAANAVYRVIRCTDSLWRILAIDPSTGALAGSRDLHTSNRPYLSLLSNTVLVDWRQPEDEHSIYVLVDHPGKLTTALVHTTGSPFAADPLGTEVILGLKDPEGPRYSSYAAMTTTDGAPARRIPGMVPSLAPSSTVGFLTDEIVDLDFDSPPTLSVWDRRTLLPPTTIPVASTCRPNRTQPTLTTVPSAVLVVCQNNEEIGGATLDIIGFR
ncbi:PQQ-binding-like beta-propeller repeat protein [Nocardia sp. NPDC050718]|uniref:outer membrane protein assembly factor BamB family protein n=1 Tax=Nocardia sp. NPDC050718 TaxID=3155788 RepID=UPI0033E805C0